MIYTVTLNPAVDKELVVPALEMDTVLRSQEINIDYGGKGFNVSRMLDALGSPSVALGFAGGITENCCATAWNRLASRLISSGLMTRRARMSVL